MKRILDPSPQKALGDLIKELTGEKRVRIQDWRRLQTKVVLSFAQSQASMSLPDLAAASIYGSRTKSGLHEKWAGGQATVSPGSAKRLDRVAPGSLECFELPLFPLLAQEPISEPEIYERLEPYRRQDSSTRAFLPWRFPDEVERLKRRDYIPVMSVTDTSNLFLYGTPHSFSVLLGLARLAESKGDLMLHVAAFRDIYRALPFLLRGQGFREHRDELIEQLDGVRGRVPLSASLFDVDWDVVSRQEADTTIELCRWKRPRCPATGRFVDLEDPILEAEIIPGQEVKRRRDAAAKRRTQRRKASS